MCEKYDGEIRELKTSVCENQANVVPAEMFKKLDEQSNYLFNENQLLHREVNDQKIEITETQGKFFYELEYLKSGFNLDQLNVIIGNVVHDFSSQISSLVIDINQLQIQISNLTENVKLLFDKRDPNLSDSNPVELPEYGNNSQLAILQSLTEKVEWLTSENLQLKEQYLVQRQEYMKPFDNLWAKFELTLFSHLLRSKMIVRTN